MGCDHRHMGRVIREIRKEKGVSQEVLSGLAGIGRTHLTMIETGRKAPSVETLSQIAAALDMPLSALFQRYENEEKQTP